METVATTVRGGASRGNPRATTTTTVVSDDDAAGSGLVRVLKIRDANGSERALHFPLSLDLERPKRPRTTFSAEQLRTLEDAFARRGYVVGSERRVLAADLGLTDTQVKVWFQNRRTKSRRGQTIVSTSGVIKLVDEGNGIAESRHHHIETTTDDVPSELAAAAEPMPATTMVTATSAAALLPPMQNWPFIQAAAAAAAAAGFVPLSLFYPPAHPNLAATIDSVPTSSSSAAATATDALLKN